MKLALTIATVALASCARDIAGLSRNERLTIYGSALTLAGKPELGAIAYAMRRPATAAKNPVRVQP